MTILKTMMKTSVTLTMTELKVTNTKTGEIWIDENEPHSFMDLALAMLKEDPSLHLVYCDIEGLAELRGEWVIMDECGNYEFMPSHYKVEVVK
ncbi:MAG: hypothetical protein MUP55_00695 [Candidatus Aenigmarchaeota archaeon]|nr:hypothetical protein [Candidatus Aenigmarchaeota archaeon]